MSFPMQPAVINPPIMNQPGFVVPQPTMMPQPTMNPNVFPLQDQAVPPMLTQPMSIATAPQFSAPIQHGWMNAPAPIANCPVGLEYLTQIDQLLVKQNVEVLEVILDVETNNSYRVQNVLGQTIYNAVEDTDCCTRQCCGSSRPFDIKLIDAAQREVVHFSRPYACSSCCFPCCLQTLEVKASGQVIGTVEQEWTLCCPSFAVKDATGQTVLRIEGPLCTSSCCCGDVDFDVVAMNGAQVGKISKQWSGLAKEAFTDADNFGITFPMDLDVRMKAVMLGACLLIDFMFFEDSPNQN